MTTMARRPTHRLAPYTTAATAVVARANANPATPCQRCGRTLAEHPPHKTGKPANWHAGHVRDGDPTSPLEPEASTCNIVAGNVARGQRKSGLVPTRQW